MSLVATRQDVGSSPSDILTNCNKISMNNNSNKISTNNNSNKISVDNTNNKVCVDNTNNKVCADNTSNRNCTDNESSVYKTEIDLKVIRPQTQNVFWLGSKDSNPAFSYEEPGVVHVISPVDDAVDTVLSSASSPLEVNDNESDVKVETRPIGKISALITRFNGVESGGLGVIDATFPSKQFRIDLQNIHKSDDNTSQNTNVPVLGQSDEVFSILGSENTRFPVVQLNVTLHTETTNPKDVIPDTNISPRNKQLSAVKTAPRPKTKPRIVRNSGPQTAVNHLPDVESPEVYCVRPSEVRRVGMLSSSHLTRTADERKVSKVREYENGRKLDVRADASSSKHKQKEHSLMQCHDTDSADNTETLAKDSHRENNIHREDYKFTPLSKNHIQVQALRESTTVSKEGKWQIEKVLKPTILPRHGGINKYSQVGNNGELFTGDVIPVSVVTSGTENVTFYTHSKETESRVTTSGLPSSTCFHGSVVTLTKEGGDLTKSNEKGGYLITKHRGDVIIHKERLGLSVPNKAVDIVVSDEKGNMTRLDNFNTRAYLKANPPVVVHCADQTSSTDTNVARCPVSTHSSVGECPTSTDSNVDECPTSTDSKVGECPPSTDSNVGEGPTSTDSNVGECPTSTDSNVGECPTSTDSSAVGCPQRSTNDAGDRINDKLDMLKSELMAMRKMDLVLLRQLINISQAIQRIQRSDLPKMSRSLTILSSKKNLQARYRPVERQNSAPHCADRRRYLFSNIKWKTEDDYRDSLSSFEDSEFDSQSELEESSSSLNNNITSSLKSVSGRRLLFHSREIPLSLDISEDTDQSYEDILKRNVRLWKMGFQRHQSVQEKVVDVWF